MSEDRDICSACIFRDWSDMEEYFVYLMYCNYTWKVINREIHLRISFILYFIAASCCTENRRQQFTRRLFSLMSGANESSFSDVFDLIMCFVLLERMLSTPHPRGIGWLNYLAVRWKYTSYSLFWHAVFGPPARSRAYAESECIISLLTVSSTVDSVWFLSDWPSALFQHRSTPLLWDDSVVEIVWNQHVVEIGWRLAYCTQIRHTHIW